MDTRSAGARFVARPVRMAAVQMAAVPGAVARNLEAAERLATAAFAGGAEWVILPEFFTTGMAFHPAMLDAARPADGVVSALLCTLARRFGGVVGGSFIASRDGDAYNTFVLAFPDGETFTHDKDIPTMWEACYYLGGADDGVVPTPRGPVGIAMCWELVRTRTVHRLRGKVDLVVAGSCWWDLPDAQEGPEADALRARNRAILADTPRRMARLLGAPLVHAAHAAEFTGMSPGTGDVPYRSRWLGEAQIVAADGRVLGRRTFEEGEGIVVADVVPGRTLPPPDAPPAGFWIPELPAAMVQAWEVLGAHGARYYQEVTRPHRLAGTCPGTRGPG